MSHFFLNDLFNNSKLFIFFLLLLGFSLIAIAILDYFYHFL